MTTESGVVGYGEAFGPPVVIASIIQEIQHLYIGKEVSQVPNLTGKLMNMFYHTASKGLMLCALSGVEIASYDAFGKILNVPVYNLLGGKARDRFKLYGSTGYITESKSLHTLKEQVERVKSLNLQAIKIKVGTSLQEDIARVKVVREHYPEVQLMIDINGNYTADLAIKSLENLEKYNIYWVEEPVPPYDYSGFKKIKQAFPSILLTTGEAEYTRYGFREIIQEAMVDIIQPDVTKCGGLHEAKAICMMAQTNNIRISPHIWGGVVGRAAAIQLMAATPHYPHSLAEPEAMLFEYDLGKNALRDQVGLANFQIDAGWLRVGDAPGLGVEIDEEKLTYYQVRREAVK
ncbi:mandelate racemase/muconate lactonizing enzyme family protein [Alkalihalobacillus oceani]|uniref:Mandelate racemase/muconate lactonizing enzyme family protein n=2 Tax=Halalkalibacter oceani TaxID=1653776 RepID=A0A9X2DSS3_9BACI|nr:mandelate racemase/muconate lactonizing enzyme family protein [Halalkalibacter oceani]